MVRVEASAARTFARRLGVENLLARIVAEIQMFEAHFAAQAWRQLCGLFRLVEYHTSCSQPIQLGDVIGNATVVQYDGEDGSAALPPPPVDPPLPPMTAHHSSWTPSRQ